MLNKNLKIEEVMFPQPRCIYQNASLAEINEIFKIHDYHHLLVVDLDGQMIGIVSEEDFKYALEQIARGSSGKTFTEQTLNHWTAERIMTKNPTYLKPQDTIQQAANHFLTNEFHALPILDDDLEIVGIITSHDLLKCAYA